MNGEDTDHGAFGRGGDQGQQHAGAFEDFASPFGRITTYSVRDTFEGATVLLTGATGFIGSLVLELLLRTTDVARVYALCRGKRGASARERVQRLLHSGLFHLVRDSPELLAKVTVIEGDMTLEGLGLSPADADAVASETHVVVHAASIIELEADAQRTLRGNYLGTKRLLLLAGRMPGLRALVAVGSTAANVNAPPGSFVDEAIYPLFFGSQEVDHASLVEDLMSLHPESANVRAQMYLDMWGFPNTYTLGKNLTEKLLAQYHAGGLPIAIVRPSLVCGLAGAPYPGYSGSLAGPGGVALAQAVGLFDTLDSVAMNPTNVWDIVPGDQVAAAVVAAAAATAARIRIDGYGEEPAGAARGALSGAGAGAGAGVSLGGGLSGGGGGAGALTGGGGGVGDGLEGCGEGPLIVHAATSTTYPISFVEAQWAALHFIAHNPPPFRLPGGGLFRVPLDFRPDPAKVDKAKRLTAWKVWFAVKVLEALGQHKSARRLKWGHVAWDAQNSAKTDRNLFFTTKNLLALEHRLCPEEAEDYVMVWTLHRGGWPRYVATTLAGMYRQVFGCRSVQGPIGHDFVFIPSREPPLLRRRRRRAGAAAGAGGDAAAPPGGAAAAAAAAGGGADGTAAGGGGEGEPLLPPARAPGAVAAAAVSPQLSAVDEEDDAAIDAAIEEELEAERDPMAATRQAVLASYATVPACGSRDSDGGAAAAAAGGGGGGGGGGRGGAAGEEADLMAAAAPPAIRDARGVLRVAAVALGRTLSYRPSLNLTASLDLLPGAAAAAAAGATSFSNGSGPRLASPLPARAASAAPGLRGLSPGPGPEEGLLGGRASLGALTRGAAALRGARAGTIAATGSLGLGAIKPSNSTALSPSPPPQLPRSPLSPRQPQ
ncbi:hypothetical protein Rsub_04777 [Raphidocelis subcapitata]|uniref:Fatty acyl-CoA reductase n=1 Tax=Raphidocelis subcapitata TaxID=307507 RepID=A0A2V0NTW3_9CHLO|nr:hypothetical protein Rsub_04777 [Raphidocelis subcapitata]|eukprot:GBF91108.1 hypothetical protein Rsub_04777 [Raphidocelis subcapitata]